MDFTDIERDFIQKVKKMFLKHNKKYVIEVQKFSGNILNFHINRSQIGRVKLHGRKMHMQVLVEKRYTQEDLDYIQELAKINKTTLLSDLHKYKFENNIIEVIWFEDISYEEILNKLHQWIEYPDNVVFNNIIEMKAVDMPYYSNVFTDELIRF